VGLILFHKVFAKFKLNMEIIRGILSIPHNNVMDLNNDMLATPYDIK